MIRPYKKTSEQGNVLFYILIAIALLASLSYAVSYSTRGSHKALSEDKAKLLATEIIEHGNTLTNAVAQLRLRNVALSDLCFDDSAWGVNDYDHAGCTDNYNKIFHPSGAGLTWSWAPSEAMASSATPDNLWHIYGDNEVSLIGTTCAGSSCADLLLVTDELDQDVCIQINKLLGVSNPSGVPPTDSAIGTTRYIGAFGYAETIGDEVGGEPLRGQAAACFQKTDAPAKYTFYKVLLAQ